MSDSLANNPRMAALFLRHAQLDLLAIVTEDGTALRYIEDQTPQLCLAAIRQTSSALRYVKDPTPEMHQVAVSKGCFLTDIRDPSLELVLAAVTTRGSNLEDVSPQMQAAHPEICLAAVTNHWPALRMVHQQTPELCLAAVKVNGGALGYVRDHRAVLAQYPDLYWIAVQTNPLALCWAHEPHYPGVRYTEVCWSAVRANGISLDYVKPRYVADQYQAMAEVAVAADPSNLRFVKADAVDAACYHELCVSAVHRETEAITSIKDHVLTSQQYYDLCLFAVQARPGTILYLSPTHSRLSLAQYHDLALRAVMQDPQTLKFVSDPTPEIRHAALHH